MGYPMLHAHRLVRRLRAQRIRIVRRRRQAFRAEDVNSTERTMALVGIAVATCGLIYYARQFIEATRALGWLG